MAWQKITDDVATTDRATSAYATQQVVENQAALEDGHARSVGHSYGVQKTLKLRPPLTAGQLGPVMVPFIAPRPPHAARIEVRLRVQAPDDGPVLVLPWIMADGQLLSATASVTVPDDAPADLLVSVDVLGQDSTASEWVVCAWGLTVSAGTSIQVSEDGGLNFQEVVAEQPGGLSGNGLILSSGGVEYTLPTGQAIYIGSTEGSQPNATALFWPPMVQAFPVSTGNVDTFGTLLPIVEVVSWSVSFRNASIRQAPYVDGGALMQVGDLPALRRRTLAGWAEQSQWWAAGPARQEAELHGRPEHVDGDCVSVPMPHHLLLAGVSGAALVQSWGGSRSVNLRTRVERLDTDGTVLATEADETTAQRTQALGIIPTTMPAFVRRFGSLTGWSARDAFMSGDIAALDLLLTSASVGAPDTDDWQVRLALDFGTARGHVAAVSLVEVLNIDDGMEVIVLGLATIWEAVDFAARPTVGLRVDDELITTDTGFRWRWSGTSWLLIQATASTWAGRPLPATVPSGAGIAAGARLVVTDFPARVDLRWDATAVAWVATPGSASIADLMPDVAIDWAIYDQRTATLDATGAAITTLASGAGPGAMRGGNMTRGTDGGVQHIARPDASPNQGSMPVEPVTDARNVLYGVIVFRMDPNTDPPSFQAIVIGPRAGEIGTAVTGGTVWYPRFLSDPVTRGIRLGSRRTNSSAFVQSTDILIPADEAWRVAIQEMDFTSSSNNFRTWVDGTLTTETINWSDGTGQTSHVANMRAFIGVPGATIGCPPLRQFTLGAAAAPLTADQLAWIAAVANPVRDL